MLFPLPSIPSSVTNTMEPAFYRPAGRVDRPGAGSHTVPSRWNRSADGTSLVTGGSRGIGRAVVLAFAGAGRACRDPLRARRDAAAESTASDARALGAEAFALAAPTSTRPRPPARWWTRRRAGWAASTSVVVNHGIWKHAPIADMTDAQWDETIARQPDERLGRLPAGRAAPGPARARRDRHHRVHRRPARRGRVRALRRVEGRADRAHAVARGRAGAARRARERVSRPAGSRPT